MPEMAQNFTLPTAGIHHLETNCQAYVLNNALGMGTLCVAER